MSAIAVEVGRWLRLAETDLRAARLLIGAETPLVEQAAFHCQQSAEKMLKAVLVSHGITPEKTHDLPRLARPVLHRRPRLHSLVEPLLPLTDWAVEPRYPGLGEGLSVDAEDVRAALPQLDALLIAVRAEPLEETP